MQDSASVKAAIHQKMAHQLTCDLTIGMEDNNLSAYTDEAVAEYLTTHHEAIALAASEMYDAYLNDNDLVSLGDGAQGCNDWYREFLYEHVVPPNIEKEDSREFLYEHVVPPNREKDD